MKRIMFVFHGNIFRSPMAEFIFKDILEKCGREIEFVAYNGIFEGRYQLLESL